VGVGAACGDSSMSHARAACVQESGTKLCACVAGLRHACVHGHPGHANGRPLHRVLPKMLPRPSGRPTLPRSGPVLALDHTPPRPATARHHAPLCRSAAARPPSPRPRPPPRRPPSPPASWRPATRCPTLSSRPRRATRSRRPRLWRRAAW
jgi:hypothetical protein